MSQLGVLYQYEMKKILKKKMTWISFCGVVLVMAFCCFGVLLNRYVLTDAQTGESVYYSAYERAMDRQARGRNLTDALLMIFCCGRCRWHMRMCRRRSRNG